MEKYVELITKLVEKIKLLEKENSDIEQSIEMDREDYLNLICKIFKLEKEANALGIKKQGLESAKERVNGEKKPIFTKMLKIFGAVNFFAIMATVPGLLMAYEANITGPVIIEGLMWYAAITIPIEALVAGSSTIRYLTSTRKERKELKGKQLSTVQTDYYNKDLDLKHCKKILLGYRRSLDNRSRQIRNNKLKIDAYQEYIQKTMKTSNELADIIPEILLQLETDPIPETAIKKDSNQKIIERLVFPR